MLTIYLLFILFLTNWYSYMFPRYLYGLMDLYNSGLRKCCLWALSVWIIRKLFPFLLSSNWMSICQWCYILFYWKYQKMISGRKFSWKLILLFSKFSIIRAGYRLIFLSIFSFWFWLGIFLPIYLSIVIYYKRLI